MSWMKLSSVLDEMVLDEGVFGMKVSLDESVFGRSFFLDESVFG